VHDHKVKRRTVRGFRPVNLYRARRGTSLVEILVAMLVLLLGIFTLVRLFPTGFTSILYGRNVSMAQALTSGVIQAARTNAGKLPDDVEAIGPNGLPFPSLDPTQELTQYPLPPANANGLILTMGPPPDARFSDINKVRRVVGETTRIPAPTTTSPYMPADGSGQRVPVSVYILQFSPIYSPAATMANLGGVFAYAGNPLDRVVFSGPPTPDQLAALTPFSYGIDYGNGVLYFLPVAYPRQFKMSYSFTIPAGPQQVAHEQAPPDNSIVVPPNTNSFDMRQAHGKLFFPLPAGTQLDANGEFLYRGFDLLANNQAFSSDNPYQFKVLNSVAGVLGFNPLGATPGAAGTGATGIIAKIDYDVDDWHIIHEDRVVPDSAPRVVKLTLNGIEPIGTADEYQEQYTGLMKTYPDRPSLTPNIDVIVEDLETGLTMDSRTLQPATNPNGAPGSGSNGAIDYRDGSIQFNDTAHWSMPTSRATLDTPIGGKRVRIYYRTPQNWGVEFTKAATEYSRVPATLNPGYREYYQGSGGYLFFPVQDHDQAVLVDYTWVQREMNHDITRTETGEYHQILDPARSDSPQNQLGAPSNNWWAQVDGALRGDVVPGSIQVLRVRGVSVRARAIWREGTRWRSLDLDSYVGRDQGT
jgi:hypothetical protein